MKKDLFAGFELVEEYKPHSEGFYSKSDLKKTKLILALGIIVLFIIFAAFVSINLKTGISPDEPAHFLFSQHYATTLGIPPDTVQTQQTGWYIQHNPFLYYWINGRVLNLVSFVAPNAAENTQLVILRLLNVLYSAGAVWFCYLLAREFLEDSLWAVLPPFLLASTLMFIFLSAAVSYDNLANLLCFISLYYLVRALKGQPFLPNSLKSLAAAFIGTLVKYPIVPFALFILIALLIYALKNRVKISQEFKPKSLLANKSLFLLLLAFIGFLAIYGYNLLSFRTLTPRCDQILNQMQCAISPYAQRYEEIALPQKLSIVQAIAEGKPDPITYVVNQWFDVLRSRTYGIFGHLQYYPAHSLIFFKVWWMVILVLVLQNWAKGTKAIGYLAGILLAYTGVLIFLSYNSELVYGFRYIALHGRYYFPVIGIAYVLATFGISQVNPKWFRISILMITLALFVVTGPIKFFLQRNSIFAGWFLP